MSDPVTIGAAIKAIAWLRSIAGFLPSGGGVPKFIKGGIESAIAARPVTEAGTLGTVPFPSTPPLIPVPGSPGAPSIPDVPGRVATGAASTFLRSWWIGALFWPSANPRGRGSQLCIETDYGPWCPPGLPNVDAAMPAPVAVPGSRGRRRPRAIPGAPGRRRRVRPLAVPQGPPRPRGRPVTLSRPRVEVSPATAAVIRAPSSSRPPMPASLPPTQTVTLPRDISVPRNVVPVVQALPTQVPSWVRELARLAPAVLGVPLLGNWVGAPNVRPNLPSSRPGQIPGLGSIPGVGPSPALNPALAPLTAFNPAVAHSPAQELDRQCKERAKQRRKKRKPRSECWKGSYTETRKGTRKHRRERIKCQ